MQFIKTKQVKESVHSGGLRIGKDVLELLDRQIAITISNLSKICKDDHVKTISKTHWGYLGKKGLMLLALILLSGCGSSRLSVLETQMRASIEGLQKRDRQMEIYVAGVVEKHDAFVTSSIEAMHNLDSRLKSIENKRRK